MRIVVMSDTHLRDVSAEFEAICARYCADADLVIHLGDWTTGAVLDYLEQYPLEAVAGNMDDYAIRDRLPWKKVIRIKERSLGLIHGWGAARDVKRQMSEEFPGVDAILFGHTHRPLQAEDNGILWFNPGSVFSGRGDLSRSLGILHVERDIRSEIIRL